MEMSKEDIKKLRTALNENYKEMPRHIFGNGKVTITSGSVDGVGYLALKDDSKHIIGELGECQGIDALIKADTLLVFKNIESARVLVLKLQQMIGYMQGIGNDTHDIENILELYSHNRKLEEL
jgi:hypothetical protein